MYLSSGSKCQVTGTRISLFNSFSAAFVNKYGQKIL